jgi:hypothetical protein
MPARKGNGGGKNAEKLSRKRKAGGPADGNPAAKKIKPKARNLSSLRAHQGGLRNQGTMPAQKERGNGTGGSKARTTTPSSLLSTPLFLNTPSPTFSTPQQPGKMARSSSSSSSSKGVPTASTRSAAHLRQVRDAQQVPKKLQFPDPGLKNPTPKELRDARDKDEGDSETRRGDDEEGEDCWEGGGKH